MLTAIALHNRYALPALPEPYLTITHAVRDADKLDIMRIMAQHLSRPIPTRDVVLRVQDAPKLWSQSIVDTVLSGGIPSYHDLRYVNDFIIGILDPRSSLYVFKENMCGVWISSRSP